MSNNVVEQIISEHHRLKESLSADPLSQLRDTAIKQFQQQGFPSIRQENWKYTDVRPIARSSFKLNEADTSEGHEKLLENARLSNLNCHEIVFINGRFSSKLSSLEGLPEGVLLKNMSLALEEDQDLLESCFRKIRPEEINNPFTTLNTAFIRDGALLSVPGHIVIDKPIHLIYLSGMGEQGFAAHPRNIILLDESAEATVIENYIGHSDSQYFMNTLTDVHLHKDASLIHYKLQQESLKAYHIGNINTSQDNHSRFTSHSISLGGALVRNDIRARLEAEGAEVKLNGLYMANGRQHIDNHTLIEHLKPHTSSDENYRGVMNDRGRGVFNGKVIVYPDAQKTDAAQSNANLLLSDHAEVDTKPELEIYADDVKCSHGSTVGQLDEDMLFYLRTRAIDEETAKSILTYAFADEVIAEIDLEPVKHYLEYQVIGRLPDAELIKEFTL